MKDLKTVIFGKGGYFNKYESILFKRYNVIAIADNDASKRGIYHGVPVISPSVIKEYGDVNILIVMEYIDFKIVEDLVKDSIDLSRINYFFRPGYLNKHDYSSSIVRFKNDYAVKVVVEKYGISFLLRHRTDFVVFNEIYLNNEYRMKIADKEAIVIDIGMNVGLASLYFAKEKNVMAVYGYEPFYQTYEMALDNIKINSNVVADKIETYNIALSDYDGMQMVDYMIDEPGNMSIVQAIIGNGEEEKNESIVVKDAGTEIRRIIEKNKEKCIVLKCDCEGSEYNVFHSLKEQGLIGCFSYFIIETHLGRGDEILRILDEFGFRYFAPVSRDGRLGMIYACKV